MLPLFEMILRQALTLVAYVRSLHVGAVVLLTAALLLPFAQLAELGTLFRRPARATAPSGSAPAPVFAAADPSVDEEATRDAPVLSVLLLGVPPDLGAPHLAPTPLRHDAPDAGAGPIRVRKDLERGPPFFL